MEIFALSSPNRYPRGVFTTHRLNADELDAGFLESLTAAFHLSGLPKAAARV